MKMIYNNVPVKSMRVHNFDVNSNDATMIASDLQSGVTAYARGKKVVGTGKSFSFASYGLMYTNDPWFIPSDINIIEVACTNYPVQLVVELNQMRNIDFSTPQLVANVIIDGTPNEITVSVIDSVFTINCDKTIKLQVFYGKDEYV